LANGEGQLRLVTDVAEIAMHGAFEEEIFVEAELRAENAGAYGGSLVLRSRDGRVMAYIHGIHLRPVAPQKNATQPEEGWLYEQAWQPAPVAAESPRPTGRHWVVFGDRAGLAGAVVDRMIHIGQSAEAVRSLEELEPTWEGPLQREIVDLRSIEAEAGDIIPAADSIGEHTIALATQSLGLWQNLIRSESRLWLFTQGAMGPCSASRIGGAIHSTLWGLARCATLEHPQRLQRIVDLDENATPDQITSTVVSELLTQDDEEQVAYCGESRQAFRLRPSELRIPELPVAPGIFHKNGSYLLTGGAGGLGMQVAAWLVQHGAGTLVLTTRSGNSIAARQPEIDALRRAGANVIAIQADVADAQAMGPLFARFGPDGDLPSLHGVFHMAADVSGTPIEAIDSAQVRSVFRAKVQGTLVLQELARTLPLDFFVTFSSTAAVLGTGGLGSYAAANSFVERITALRAAEGLPFISVSWGTWQTMRLASRETQEQYSSCGMLPMPDDAALKWLESLLHRRDLKQPIVANIDWATFVSLFEAKRRRSWLELVRPQIAQPKPGSTPSWTAEPDESRLTSLERAVQKEAGRVLGFRRSEVPAANARLADLGLDSLMAVSLRNRLQKLTGCSLSATFAFEHATPSQMAMALDMILWGSGAADEERAPTEREEIGI
jgi:NAD(P)-dependent dehydrogenase (short-subunit alcohol dehydrogenase family)/acyl carrier protein